MTTYLIYLFIIGLGMAFVFMAFIAVCWGFAFVTHDLIWLVDHFICGKNPDREVGDEELPESSWLGMVRG